MALLKVNNVRIAGISAGVPKNIVKNTGNEIESKEYDASDFVETTGVAERRVTNELTTSDLCYGAAEKLIADLGWDKVKSKHCSLLPNSQIILYLQLLVFYRINLVYPEIVMQWIYP